MADLTTIASGAAPVDAKRAAYDAKLADLEGRTLLPHLEPEVGEFVRGLARQ